MSEPDTRRPPCGCAVGRDAASGVLRSAFKCAGHRAQMRGPSSLDGAYYRGLGALDADAPARYVGELEEALGPLPRADPPAWALEVGCGASPYVTAIRARGWTYTGVDLCWWAVGWMVDRYGPRSARRLGLEDLRWGAECGLVLAAHAFEHMADAPGAIRRCAEMLRPGGELWVIVPDDSDLCNADHVWFFDRGTLRACLESAGLEVVREAAIRRVPHEVFLYARARKPG